MLVMPPDGGVVVVVVVVVESLVLNGTEIAERRVSRGVLDQPSMYSKTACRSPVLVGHERVDELAPNGGEEATRPYRVGSIHLAPDKEHDAVGPGQLGEVTAGILTRRGPNG